MSDRPVIYEVICRWGLVDDPTNWQGLKTTVIGRDELSKEVVDAIFDTTCLPQEVSMAFQKSVTR